MNAKIAVIFAWGILAVSSAKAGVLFSQTDNHEGGWQSQSGVATVYDDFTLSGGGTVTTVDWTGTYTLKYATGLTGFALDFWSDKAGLPGTLLASDNIVGTANETSLGTFIDGIFPQYSYSTTLGSTFRAAPGTEYWVSIVADLPTSSANWYWDTSGAGGGDAYQYRSGGFFGLSSDMAFTLEGTSGTSAVADGGASALLLGMGLTGLSLAKRKP